MYIYTNPHRSQHSTNFTNAQIHQVTYSIMTQFTNHSNACNVLDSSRCMRYRHQQQRSSPHDATKTSYPFNTKYSNLTTGCKHPNTQYDYDAWTYKQRLDNAKSKVQQKVIY